MFNKVKEKFNDRVSNEKLGKVNAHEEMEDIVEITNTSDQVTMEDIYRASEEDDKPKSKNKKSTKSVANVLKMFNISDSTNMDTLIKASQLENVQFSLSTPVGFDQDEVADLIMRMISQANEVETILKQRDMDVIRLASEIEKSNNSMAELKNTMQMNMLLDDSETELNDLRMENSQLRVKVNELDKSLSKSRVAVSISDEVNMLKAENESLKSSVTELRVVVDKQAREIDQLNKDGGVSQKPIETKATSDIGNVDDDYGDDLLEKMKSKDESPKTSFESMLYDIGGESE